MRISVLALSPQQIANTRKTLRALTQHTKELSHDLSDSRVDVSDLQGYIKRLCVTIDRLNSLLYDEEPAKEENTIVATGDPVFETS